MTESDKPADARERYRQRIAAQRERVDAGWTKRGQGWLHSGVPTSLEPPFSRPLEEVVRGGVAPSADPDFESDADWVAQDLEAEFAALDDQPIRELKLSLPSSESVPYATSEQLLLALKSCTGPVAFEVIGDESAITLQLACRKPDYAHVANQVRAHLPEAVISESNSHLEARWKRVGRAPSAILELGLSRNYLFPLRTYAALDADLLLGIVGTLDGLQTGEVGLLQVLFQPARQAWADRIWSTIAEWERHGAHPDASSRVLKARAKIARPLYAAVVRVAARSLQESRAQRIVRALSSAFAPLALPVGNELVPLPDHYDLPSEHAADVLKRRSRRSGMILNSEELATLVHLPSPAVRSPKLRSDFRRTKAAPEAVLGHRLVLGENTHGGRTVSVGLAPHQRTSHTHIIGATGTGKSSLLLNLIRQDIEQGEGVCVLDPHGDLIDSVLGLVPERRHEDVVLFDAGDGEYPVGFNILAARSDLEKTLLSSDLVAVFRRLSTSWGDQMTAVLGNAILAFLESSEGGTLADLRRFLVDAEYRRGFLPTVSDPEVVFFWQREFPLLTGRSHTSLLVRLDAFLRPRPVRHIVGQKESRLDLGSVIAQGKVLLVKLAAGAIGEENAYLLGSLFIAKLHQLALSRQQVPEAERKPFYVYVDECHAFLTPSMAAILTGGRKFGIGLTLAHQELPQLSSGEGVVASAVLSNPHTRICFRVGDADARKLADGFASFGADDLMRLGTGEAICRVGRADFDFNLKTLAVPAVDAPTARRRTERIAALSRERYAVPREEVEAALAKARPRIISARAARPAPESEPEVVREEVPVVEAQTPTTQAPIPRPISPAPPPPATPPSRPPRRGPPEPPTPGRGGQRHKYIQQLVKRTGEEFGFRSSIEKTVLDGKGSVDVALEKEGRAIACEISVTSTVDQEAKNALKCLDAGYDPVVLIFDDQRQLTKCRDRIAERLGEAVSGKVHYLLPEEVYPFLNALEADAAGKEDTVRGYKVKVRYRPLDPDELEARKRAISKIVFHGLRRMKD